MSEAYKLTGKIIVLNDTQTFASGFAKREFVVETTDDKYPQQIKLEAVKAGCDKLDAFRIGDEVSVDFNLRGNEFNGKYYVSLSAWKIERVGQSHPPLDAHNQSKANGYQPQRSPNQNGAPPPSQTATADELDEDFSDIPF